MQVVIWGPTDSSWHEAARVAARTHFPGYSVVDRVPSTFSADVPEAEAGKVTAVVVHADEKHILEAYRAAGLKPEQVVVVASPELAEEVVSEPTPEAAEVVPETGRPKRSR